MIRAEAVSLVLEHLESADLVVAADGAIAREAHRTDDRPRTFPMLGSMGQVASIALGLALTRKERVVALDGDGNLLMGLGGLAMVGGIGPVNLYHVVLDNQSYATTGGQTCLSSRVDLTELARSAGYTHTTTVDGRRPDTVEASIGAWLQASGPSFLRILVEAHDPDPAARIPRPPEEMAARFRRALDVED